MFVLNPMKVPCRKAVIKVVRMLQGFVSTYVWVSAHCTQVRDREAGGGGVTRMRVAFDSIKTPLARCDEANKRMMRHIRTELEEYKQRCLKFVETLVDLER